MIHERLHQFATENMLRSGILERASAALVALDGLGCPPDRITHVGSLLLGEWNDNGMGRSATLTVSAASITICLIHPDRGIEQILVNETMMGRALTQIGAFLYNE